MQYGDINNFWFQPKRVEMKDANPYQNNNFLAKYWGEGSKAGEPSRENSYNLFKADNYYNADFGTYENKAKESGFSYDSVMNELESNLGKTQSNDNNNSDNTNVPSSNNNGISRQNAWLNSYNMSSFEPNYNEYFDSIFN